MLENPFQDHSPIILPKPPSDRDKTLINRMCKEAFSYPPARKRKSARKRKRRKKF